MMQTLAYASPLVGLLALGFAFLKSKKVNGADAGNDRMKEIAGDIREGAMAFLMREYQVLAVYSVVVFGLLWLAFGTQGTGMLAGLCFLLGAFLSMWNTFCAFQM